MPRTKVSVTLDDAALDWLRQRAKQWHGGNLSAAITETTELARKSEALRSLLDADGAPRLSAAELGEITSAWSAKGPRKRRRSSATSRP